jgi:hypothetical protein
MLSILCNDPIVGFLIRKPPQKPKANRVKSAIWQPRRKPTTLLLQKQKELQRLLAETLNTESPLGRDKRTSMKSSYLNINLY